MVDTLKTNLKPLQALQLAFTGVLFLSPPPTLGGEEEIPVGNPSTPFGGDRFPATEMASLDQFKQKIIGRYAHFDVVAYEQKFFLTQMKTMVVTYGITEFFDTPEGNIISRSRYCHASHLSNFPFKSEVPDSFTQAIIPRDAMVQFKPDGPSWRVIRPETPTPIGIKLDDPDEPLPMDPKDPRITDDDHDGKPGVTVKLTLYGQLETEIYIARREIFSYNLTLQENGELIGTVTDRSEQLVVGSPLAFLRGPNSPTQHPDLSLSPIHLIPIDQDMDCKAMMTRRNLLFPPEPPVWRGFHG